MGSVTYDVIGTAQHRLWLQKSEINVSLTRNISSLHTPLREKEVEKEQEQIKNNHEYKKKFLGLTRMTLDQTLSQTNLQIIRRKEQISNNLNEEIDGDKEKKNNSFFPLF